MSTSTRICTHTQLQKRKHTFIHTQARGARAHTQWCKHTHKCKVHTHQKHIHTNAQHTDTSPARKAGQSLGKACRKASHVGGSAGAGCIRGKWPCFDVQCVAPRLDALVAKNALQTEGPGSCLGGQLRIAREKTRIDQNGQSFCIAYKDTSTGRNYQK